MRKVLVKKLVRQLLVRTQVPPSLYPQGPDIWTTRKKDGWWNTYYAQVYRLHHCPLDCLNSNLHLQHRNGRQKWLCQFYFSQSQPLTKCYEMPRIDHSLKSWMENHIKYADLVQCTAQEMQFFLWMRCCKIRDSALSWTSCHLRIPNTINIYYAPNNKDYDCPRKL